MVKPTNSIQRLVALAAMTSTSALQAQIFEFDDDEESMETVKVVGSRNAGRTSAELPIPIDTINAERLQLSGQFELGRMLQNTLPSFNFSSSSISDGTDALRPATLRGLGPDQTLVLINGKRRHTSSLIHINTSVGRGTAGVDMNALPSSSIKRIEILRDGAAAQYGSDAIAGVINIVLKDDVSDEAYLSYGEYNEGDGETVKLSLNKGFELENGLIQTTLELRDRGYTNRAGLSGTCQYLAGCMDTDGDGISNALDPRESTFNRTNFRIGDAESEQLSFVANGYWENLESELYGFVSYSARENESAGFYRRANEPERNPTLTDGEAFFPDGFLPLIKTQIDDYSASFGYAAMLDNGGDLDLSITYGKNTFEFNVSNSINASFVQDQINNGIASLRDSVPTTANAGELSLELLTINLDLSQEFEKHNLAYGFEYRIDGYDMKAGEPYSYLDYDGTGLGGAAGIQVFPGITPQNIVNESRNVFSAYLDIEYDFSEQWLLSGALRYDHYDDFGSTTNLKVASRYDLSPQIALRGSVSTGFRAPSMQQQYFNNVSTQFNSGVAAEVGTFRNDSRLATDIGIPRLKEEESVNLSLGLVFLPNESWTVTLDYYDIDIDDRIVISEQLSQGIGSTALDIALQNNGVQSAQFFINAADTRTRGIDLVATHSTNLASGIFEATVALNVTDTEVNNIFTSGGLEGIEPNDLFGSQAVSIIEEWQPSDHVVTSFYYGEDNWDIAVNFNRFGDYAVVDGNERQEFSAKWVTDVKLSYQLDSNWQLTLGANNLFDETPDRNRVGQSRGGMLQDFSGQEIVNSPGVFQFSRRAAPFGFNGAFYYASAHYTF